MELWMMQKRVKYASIVTDTHNTSVVSTKDYDEYKIHKNVIQYLKVVGFRCQGIQI